MFSIRGLKLLDIIISVVAIGMVIYHMVQTLHILQGPVEHLNTHLLFTLLLVYLVSLRGNVKRWPVILPLILLSLVATGYIKIFYDELEIRMGFPTQMDVVIGVILIILVLDACRRAFGMVLPIVALLFMGYAFWGHYLPGAFASPHSAPSRIIADLTTGFTGIYGTILEISAYFIFLFVVMGGVIQVTGAQGFFRGIGALAGRALRGGPGMTSVVSSSLVGTVTGSTASNIAITGAFTIPLMKKVGYRPSQAGAIEAAASNGGQIMPPIMGAAAFVMAGMTGIPYLRIAQAAFLPAVAYFLAAGLYVQLTALKLKLTPLSVLGERVNVKEMLWGALPFFFPLGLIMFLFFRGFTPMYVALWAIVACFLLGFLRRGGRPSLSEWVEGFANGAKVGATIAISCAVIGIIVKVMTMTGLAIKLPAAVEGWSLGNLPLALLLVMFISLLLGCGVPTTPAYILVAITAAPVLVKMGLSALVAHFFVFFFAVQAMVTPPVAPGAIVASRIAGAPFWETSIESVKAALGGFIIPFIFVMSPMLLLQPGDNLLWETTALTSGLLVLLSFEIGLVNYYFAVLSPVERALFFTCGLLLFVNMVVQHSYMLFAVGIVLFSLLTLSHLRGVQRSKAAAKALTPSGGVKERR